MTSKFHKNLTMTFVLPVAIISIDDANITTFEKILKANQQTGAHNVDDYSLYNELLHEDEGKHKGKERNDLEEVCVSANVWSEA